MENSKLGVLEVTEEKWASETKGEVSTRKVMRRSEVCELGSAPNWSGVRRKPQPPVPAGEEGGDKLKLYPEGL